MSQKVELNNLIISDSKDLCQLNVDIQKFEKDILLTVPNPEFKTLVYRQ